MERMAELVFLSPKPSSDSHISQDVNPLTHYINKYLKYFYHTNYKICDFYDINDGFDH